MAMRFATIAGAAILLLGHRPAFAATELADRDYGPPSASSAPTADDAESPPASPQSPAAQDGLALPFSLSARNLEGRAWARVLAGYDGAARAFRAASSAEGALTRRMALRVDFEHAPSTSAADRLSVGVRLHLLSQEIHGLDLGCGLFYRPTDFRGEGNLARSHQEWTNA